MQISNEEWEAHKGSQVHRAIREEIERAGEDVRKITFASINEKMTNEEIASLVLHAKGTIDGFNLVLEMDLGEDIKE